MPVSRQRSTSKAQLSEEAIVDAALEILQKDGLDAVTMRKVAAALDTGPGSLYVWVENRDRLLEAMQDRVAATIEVEKVVPSRWRAQVHRLLERMRASLAAHPGLAVVALSAPPRSEEALDVIENMLGLLMAGGMDPRTASLGADVLAQLVVHVVVEEEMRTTSDDGVLAARIADRFSDLPPDRFPILAEHVDDIVHGDSDQRFRDAIDVVLDGLLARAAGPWKASKKRG